MTLEIIIVLLLILLNGLFAMAEMALVSSRRARLKHAADQGDKGAKAALALAESPSRFLSTVQIGITMIGVLAGAFGGATISESIAAWLVQFPQVAEYADPISIGAVVVAITVLSLILGELVPKRLALSRPESISRALARPMTLMSRLAAPAVWLLSAATELVLKLIPIRHGSEPAVTDEEIKLLMQQGTEAGHFHPAEKTIVDMALRLGDRRISAMMTPRTQVEWLDLSDPIEETRQKIRESHYSRFPVAEGGRRNFVGVVEAKDLLAASLDNRPFDLRAAIKPALYIPETAPALKALEIFRETGKPIALIIDEYGDFQGLVTLEDVLVALVGELQAPDLNEAPAVTERADGSWLVDGLLSIDELKDRIKLVRLPDEEEASYQTVAGLVMAELRRIPKAGDSFQVAGFEFEVVDMDGRRIDKVLVTRRETADEETEGSEEATA
ncbi:MAG TPA: hemolysin family protein [Dongiaceae bacterium]